MSTDIRTRLVYSKDDGTRPYFYAMKRSDSEIMKSEHKANYGGQSAIPEVLVKDARGQKLTLDNHSFQMFEQNTKLSTEDFYNPDTVRSAYYPEVVDLIKAATGAAHVYVFHNQVRNKDRNQAKGDITNLNTNIQGYAAGIHSDSCPISADDTFRKFSCLEENTQYRKGRFMYINAWRNISEEPVSDNHLAVLDESSTVKPDDYIISDLILPSYKMQQYRLNVKNSEMHRWYYFSHMKKNEVLLFKHYDSDTTCSGRVCFHTAFTDSNAPVDAPTRESIEVRAYAYFPDHEPNTCPEIEMEPYPEDAETVIEESVKKIYAHFDLLAYYPKQSLDEFEKGINEGERGARMVILYFVDDDENYFGLKHAHVELKQNILAKLIEGKFGEQLKAAIVAIPESDEDQTNNRVNPLKEQISINEGVSKLMAAIGVLEYWPKEALGWLEAEIAKGETGIETVAKTLVQDDQNHQGLKFAEKELKTKIISSLLDGGFGDQLKKNLSKMKK